LDKVIKAGAIMIGDILSSCCPMMPWATLELCQQKAITRYGPIPWTTSVSQNKPFFFMLCYRTGNELIQMGKSYTNKLSKNYYSFLILYTVRKCLIYQRMNSLLDKWGRGLASKELQVNSELHAKIVRPTGEVG
jgi:hypothetical protein